MVDSSPSLETLADFLNWANQLFVQSDLYFGHGTNNAWDEAVHIALHVLQLPPNVTQEALTSKLSDRSKTSLIEVALQRASKKKPLPYITKEAWFAGQKYYVDSRVIIPRSPIAELIARKFQPWLKTQPHKILDLCTGSGCIAIACAKEFPDCVVHASDISEDALNVAEKNIKLHKASRITLFASDLFVQLQGHTYDLIISNPPYVGNTEFENLPQEFSYEPTQALLAGNEGKEIVEQILQQAQRFLTDTGILIVEVGYLWQDLMKAHPKIPFTWLELANGGEGVFMLTKQQLEKL